MLKKLSFSLTCMALCLALPACAKTVKPSQSTNVVCDKAQALKLQKMVKTEVTAEETKYELLKQRLFITTVGDGVVISAFDDEKLQSQLKLNGIDFADFGDAFALRNYYVIELLTEYSTQFYVLNYSKNSLTNTYKNSYLFEKYTPKKLFAKGTILETSYNLLDKNEGKYIAVGTSYKSDCFKISK